MALLVTLALGVATFFVVRGLIEEPDPAASGLTSDTTGAPSTGPSDASGDEAPATGAPDPSEAPSGADLPTGPPGDVAPTVEQCTGGLPEQGVSGRDGQFMTGGGLRVRTPEGFEPTLDQAFRFTFADGVYAPSKIIEVTDTSGWVAVYALGSLNRGNGLDSPRQAAEVVMTCMLQSTNFYSDVTITYQLGSEETVVDGNPAWLLSQEVHIDDPELSVEGDVAKVVVVDTGDPAAYALFVSVVPIGDQVLIDEQDATIGALEVP